MGYLKEGRVLDYVELLKVSDKVRQLGIHQFLHLYTINYNRKDPDRVFGDEIEYMLVSIDHEHRKVRLLPASSHLLEYIKHNDLKGVKKASYMPEYASYMIEAVPDSPYSLNSDFIEAINSSLCSRRNNIQSFLEGLGFKNCKPVTFSSFPRLGCPDCIYTGDEEFKRLLRLGNGISQGRYLNDTVINANDRFAAITKNIRTRKGKISIFMKAYKEYDHCSISTNTDKYMPSPPESFASKEFPGATSGEESDIHYDPPLRSGTVPGNSKFVDGNGSESLLEEKGSLQERGNINQRWGATSRSDPSTLLDEELTHKITKSVMLNDVRTTDDVHVNNYEARTTEDTDESLIHMDGVIFGMGMCCLQTTFSCVDINEARYLYDQLTVMAPILISLSASTVVFRGKLASTDTRWSALCQAMDDRKLYELNKILKPRYSTVSLYIGNGDYLKKNYDVLNDLNVACRADVYLQLLNHGVDAILARHVSHLFVYQPLVVYDEDLDEIDSTSTDEHFEVFQSTNWNSVRFKPPPLLNNTIPWRVEFRCCEVQMKDEDNSLFISLIAYMVKVILSEKWNLYMPLSLVDENMERSSFINSYKSQKFYFQSDVFNVENRRIKEFSLSDLLFSENGLFTRCESFLKNELELKLVSIGFYNNIIRNFNTLKKRCYGSCDTGASEIRRFVLNHPKYNGDSIVNDDIVYDLINTFENN